MAGTGDTTEPLWFGFEDTESVVLVMTTVLLNADRQTEDTILNHRGSHCGNIYPPRLMVRSQALSEWNEGAET